MFYAAINSYATPTSTGFANTWGVLVFATKSARDTFVDSCDDMATRAIVRKEIKEYVTRTPKPFTGERYVVEHTPSTIDGNAHDGLVGAVGVGHTNDCGYIRRLNNR